MKEINEKYSKQIYLNILKAIIVMAYFLTLNLAYQNVRTEYMEIAANILTIVFLFIGIYIIERAYKKDDGTLAIQGIEVLILATYTLTTEHIINKFDFNFKSYSLVASYLYAAYFLLRSIFIYTKGRKEVAEELNDIKDIVKKEEPVKKEAVKKSEKKEENKQEDKKEEIVEEKLEVEDKKDNEKEKDVKDNKENVKTEKKVTKKTTKTTTKKQGTSTTKKKSTTSTSKKSSTTKNVSETKKENTEKKATTSKSGTSKNSTTKKIDSNKKTTTVKKAETKKTEPKKKKEEVKEND